MKTKRFLLATAGSTVDGRTIEPQQLTEMAKSYDPETYAARLNICRTCDNLHSGTCALCGCYLEARAAKKRQGCPKVPEMWGAEEAE